MAHRKLPVAIVVIPPDEIVAPNGVPVAAYASNWPTSVRRERDARRVAG